MPRRKWITFAPRFTKRSDHNRLVAYARGIGRLTDRRATKRPKERTVTKEFTAAAKVLNDLVLQGWACRVVGSQIKISRPGQAGDLSAEKDRLQRQLHVERNRQLKSTSVTVFLREVEQRRLYQGGWVSIFSLMRDGTKLAKQLAVICAEPSTAALDARLRGIIQPYVQVVTGDETCTQTGIRLNDIWRYFRHTWANAYKSVPGRSVMVLIRDAAVQPNAVIGIGALSSSAVQISARDQWIGWTAEQIVENLRQAPSESHLAWLLGLIEKGLAEIYKDDLLDPAMEVLSPREIAVPSVRCLKRLLEFSSHQREAHDRLVDAREHKDSSRLSTGDRWLRQAETPLFRSKRAETLAVLLRARMALQSTTRAVTVWNLQNALRALEGREAIQALIRKAKSDRVGVAMADITVCGAVPPYSALTAGKLVAMLIASPQVINSYHARYADAESIIASSIAGRPIIRNAELGLLVTTSLYDREPTQYTRIAIPCERAGGRKGEILRFELLGRTEGFGTFHFSQDTVRALTELVSRSTNGQRVNSIFGEGVNPRMRKIRQGLDQLGLPSDQLLTHGNPRLVYGVPLARNFRDYLLGLDQRPEYLLPVESDSTSTHGIVNWWIERWLAKRVSRADVLEAVAKHSLVHPITHGARPGFDADSDEWLPFSDIVGSQTGD